MGQLRSARAGLLAVSAVALLSLLGLAALHGRHAAVAARTSAGWAWHDAACAPLSRAASLAKLVDGAAALQAASGATQPGSGAHAVQPRLSELRSVVSSRAGKASACLAPRALKGLHAEADAADEERESLTVVALVPSARAARALRVTARALDLLLDRGAADSVLALASGDALLEASAALGDAAKVHRWKLLHVDTALPQVRDEGWREDLKAYSISGAPSQRLSGFERARRQAMQLAAATLVATDFYLVIEAGVVPVRPLGRPELLRGARGVVDVADEPVAVGGRREQWRQSGDLLGAHMAGRAYGGGRGVMLLARDIVIALLSHIEARHKRKWHEVLIGGSAPWAAAPIYFTFAETSGMFDHWHVACDGALMSVAQDVRDEPLEVLDLDALFAQSYTMFTRVSALAGSSKAKAAAAEGAIIALAEKRATEEAERAKALLDGRVRSAKVAQGGWFGWLGAARPQQVQSQLSAAQLALERNAILKMRETALALARERGESWAMDTTIGVEARTEALQAYLVLVCSASSALPAAVLALSLKSVGSTRTRVAMVPKSLGDSEKLVLEATFDRLVTVDVVANPNGDDEFRKESERSHGVGQAVAIKPHGDQHCDYTKLKAWGLSEYDKVVILDADMLVRENIDSLFDRPAGAAAPDMMPPDAFNAALIVAKPSAATHDSLLASAASIGSYDGGVGGFLNQVYVSWHDAPRAFRLRVGFNTQLRLRGRGAAGFGLTAAQGIKAVHYAEIKPADDVCSTDKTYGWLLKEWWRTLEAWNKLQSDELREDVSGLLKKMNVHQRELDACASQSVL